MRPETSCARRDVGDVAIGAGRFGDALAGLQRDRVMAGERARNRRDGDVELAARAP